jgi:phytoene desaturase
MRNRLSSVSTLAGRREREEMTKTILIIGAGLSGLSAGIYAQANGYSTTILEQHSVAGGLAAWWRRGDYLIDDGIHFLMGHRPGTIIYEMYEQLGIPEGLGVVDMKVYGSFTDIGSGRRLEITDDMERLRLDMLSLFPKDRALIDDLFSKVNEMRSAKSLMEMGFGDPMELMGLLGKVKIIWMMRKELKFFSGDYAVPIVEYAARAKDPMLREILLNLFTPDSPLWFVLMILALLANGQMGLLGEGCERLVLNLVRRYESLGGEILLKSKVKEIVVVEGKAVGVRTIDGEEKFADVIISAADGRSTIYEMLGGRYLDTKIEERYAHWQLTNGFLLISYGVTMPLDGASHTGYVFLKEPVVVEGKERRAVSYRVLNYGRAFAPPGKCVVQAFYESDFDYWAELRQDRDRYQEEKRRVADLTARAMEQVFPGFQSSIEMVDVATPYTTYRYTSNWKGSPMGWSLSKDQMTKVLPRTLPGLKGFFMIGQWAQPGGGVPSCLGQGRQIVQILCHEDRKPFLVPAK